MDPPDAGDDPGFTPPQVQNFDQPSAIPPPPLNAQTAAALSQVPLSAGAAVPKFRAPARKMPPPEDATLAAAAPPPEPSPITPTTPPVAAPAAGDPNSPTARLAALKATPMGQQASAPPGSNWAQRLGLAIMSMTKLAPVANQIIHPKWSANRAAFEQAEGDIASQAKVQEAEENIGGLTEQRQATAEQRQANAAKFQQQSDPHYGKVAVDPSYAPAITPGPDGKVWVKEDVAAQLQKADKSSRPIVLPENSPGVLDPDSGDLIWKNPNYKPKQEKPPKTLGDDARIAAVAAGIDPDKSPEEWTPEEAQKVQKILTAQKIAARPVVNNNIPAQPMTPQQRALADQSSTLQPGQRNEAFLASLPPDQQTIVKAFADYTYPKLSSFALRPRADGQPGYYQDLLNKAFTYDPAFDYKQYDTRQRVMNDFTSGNSSRNIRSLKTLTGHLGTLQEMSEALNNGDVQGYNKLANYLATQFGNPKLTNFNLAKAAVSGELATAFKGTATDPEIKTWADAINSAGSPEQMKGAVSVPVQLMYSRLGAFQDQYQNAMGGKSFPLLSAETRAAFQKIGMDPNRIDPRGSGGSTVTLKDGRTATFPSQQQADAFRKDHPDKVK